MRFADELLRDIKEYYLQRDGTWLPVSTWASRDLADLETMVNGELQRREADRDDSILRRL